MSEPKPASKPSSSGARGAVEVAARTVDEAIARGLVRLGGLSRAEVQIDVVREGRAGLLGFGAEDALVRLTPVAPGAGTGDQEAVPPRKAAVTPDAAAATDDAAAAEERRGRRRRRGRDEAEAPAEAPSSAAKAAPTEPSVAQLQPIAPPAPPPAPERVSASTSASQALAAGADSTEAAAAVALDLVRLLGYAEATVEIQDSLLPDGEDDDIGSAVLCIRGRGTERFLNEDSAALNALQFVTRLIVSRSANAWCNVLLDVDGDRRRRVKELLALASQSAELVESGGKPVSLPPMGAYERRVVHLALRDHATVATQSIGNGTYRKVTVRRRDQMLPDM